MDAIISRHHPSGSVSRRTSDTFRIPFQIYFVLRRIVSIVCTINSGLKWETNFRQLRSVPKDLHPNNEWVRRCQTNSNRSQFPAVAVNLCGSKLAPLNQSSGAVQFETFSGVKVAFQVKMIVNRGMDGCEFL